MNIIEQVLLGDVDVMEFVGMLTKNQDLQRMVRDFLPPDAINDQSHPFWRVVPYETLRKTHFDYYEFLFWGLYSNSLIGNKLNIFSRLCDGYLFHHPDVQCTNKYSAAFDLYLDVIHDCFDGPEVRPIVDKIIVDALPEKTKGKRIQQAKKALAEQFHIAGKNRPRWIQGPEWPMGANSPMKFISQRRSGDAVQYLFQDVDTGEERTVVQYY